MRIYRVCFRFLFLLLVFLVTSFSNSIQLSLCHSLVRSVRWRAFPHPDSPAFDGIITPLHEWRGEGKRKLCKSSNHFYHFHFDHSATFTTLPHPVSPAFDGIITPLHEWRGEGEEETLHIMLLHIANLHRFF